MKYVLACLWAALLASPALGSVLMAGGSRASDASDQLVVDAAAFAVQQINRRENSMFALVLSSIQEANQQVVAGVKYSLVVVAERSTDCRNDGAAHSQCSCSVDEKQKKSFSVEVLSQPWLEPQMKLLSMKEVPMQNSLESATNKMSLGAVIGASSTDFQTFLKENTPAYCNNAAEIVKRSAIFDSNMDRIKKYQQTEKGSATYGITKFADLSEDEFRTMYLQNKPMQPDNSLPQTGPVDVTDMPTDYDWREHNAVTEVKNQGSCGSCWAFSTTGNIEGQWAIKKGALISLSEQELVDCDHVDHGCGGGLPSQAYQQIMSLGGLTTEAKYPYRGVGGSCTFNPKTQGPLVTINGSVTLPQDEGQLAAWLAKNGPISIGINAGPMQFYMGGIAHPWKILCNPAHLDHGVLIVGYGMHESEPYWIIKNSWGASWGEKGYYRLYRGAGVCGVNRMATSSVVA